MKRNEWKYIEWMFKKYDEWKDEKYHGWKDEKYDGLINEWKNVFDEWNHECLW